MKKRKKLQLNKETLRTLSQDAMARIAGGYPTQDISCLVTDAFCGGTYACTQACPTYTCTGHCTLDQCDSNISCIGC